MAGHTSSMKLCFFLYLPKHSLVIHKIRSGYTRHVCTNQCHELINNLIPQDKCLLLCIWESLQSAEVIHQSGLQRYLVRTSPFLF